MTARRSIAVAACFSAVLLALALAACSGVNPSGDDDPDVPPGSPCGGGPVAYNAFPNGFGQVGSDTTLEVGTWNLLNFPSEGQNTIDLFVDILKTIDLDVLGVEEIADTTAFRQMVNRLPGYGGVYSPDTYGFGNYQKTGIIWKKSVASVLSWGVPAAFDSSRFSFPDNFIANDTNTLADSGTKSFVWASRPPIEATIQINSPRRSYTFHFIVMHLKAGKDEADSQTRRRCATYVIHRYLDQQVDLNPQVRYVLAGDWNDLLTDKPLEVSSFMAFLDDPGNYLFLTQALLSSVTGSSYYTSHPIGQIDHLAVNRNACADFAPGRITVLRFDLLLQPPGYPVSYTTYGSDHRPVVVVVPGF